MLRTTYRADDGALIATGRPPAGPAYHDPRDMDPLQEEYLDRLAEERDARAHLDWVFINNVTNCGCQVCGTVLIERAEGTR